MAESEPAPPLRAPAGPRRMRAAHAATVPEAPPPTAERVFEAAREALGVEHAHAEASRSRAAGLLTACGVLLALTVGLGASAAQAAQRLSHVGAPIAVCAAAAAALCLLAAAVLSGLVFAPSSRSRTPVEELRELSETRLRVADDELLSARARERLDAARLPPCSRGEGSCARWAASVVSQN